MTMSQHCVCLVGIDHGTDVLRGMSGGLDQLHRLGQRKPLRLITRHVSDSAKSPRCAT